MKQLKSKFLQYVNIPHHITEHVVGKHHTVMHRRIAGVIVMFIGVTLAHMSAHISNVILALTGDLIGYSIHATGFLPYLEGIEKKTMEANSTKETTQDK